MVSYQATDPELVRYLYTIVRSYSNSQWGRSETLSFVISHDVYSFYSSSLSPKFQPQARYQEGKER
jgi:hypothetical protein